MTNTEKIQNYYYGMKFGSSHKDIRECEEKLVELLQDKVFVTKDGTFLVPTYECGTWTIQFLRGYSEGS